MLDPKKSDSLRELWIGIGISVGIYLIGLLSLFIFPSIFLIYIMAAPIALIVLTIIIFAKGRKRMGQGFLIGIGLDILLFAACFGIFFGQFG